MTLADIYKQIPKMNCRGLCHTYCGVIAMTSPERAAIDEVTTVPYVTTTSSMACPLLVNNRCSAYEARPAICRLWGTVKAPARHMRCPHGCKPKRWLSDAQARAILDQLRDLAPNLRALHADFDAKLQAENATLAVGGLKP